MLRCVRVDRPESGGAMGPALGGGVIMLEGPVHHRGPHLGASDANDADGGNDGTSHTSRLPPFPEVISTDVNARPRVCGVRHGSRNTGRALRIMWISESCTERSSSDSSSRR